MADRQVLKITGAHSSSSGHLRSTKSSLLLSSFLLLVFLSAQCVTYGFRQAELPRGYSRSFYSRLNPPSKDAADDNALNELLDEFEREKSSKGIDGLQFSEAATSSEYQLDNAPSDSEDSTVSYLEYFLPQTESSDSELDFSRLNSDLRFSSPSAESNQQLTDTYTGNLDNLHSTDLLSYLADQAELAENDVAESGKTFYHVDEEYSDKSKANAPFTTLVEDESKVVPDNAKPIPTTVSPKLSGGVVINATNINNNNTRGSISEDGAKILPKDRLTVEPREPELSQWSITSLFHNLYQSLTNFIDSKLSHAVKPLEGNSSKTTQTTSSEETSASASPALQSVGLTKPSSVSVPVKKVQPRKKNINDSKVEEDENYQNQHQSSSSLPVEAGAADQRQMVYSTLLDDNDDDDVDVDDGANQVKQVTGADHKPLASHRQVSATSPHGLPRVSLLRQSSLTLPIYQDEQPMAHSPTPRIHTISTQFLEPSRHHSIISNSASSRGLRQHVGSYDNRDDSDVDDIKVMFADEPSHHAAYLSSLRAGDHIFGPYRTYYDHTHPESSVGLNKSNDIYFLVMVVAFCAMAIAVVLSAGLFTYRIQQNRKANSDQDYPTYGVVGPNNMTGKCGPAAFVGRYFGDTPGGVVGSSVSATKTSKGLPDYGDIVTEVSSSGTASTKSNKSAIDRPTGVANGMNVTANNRSVSGFMVDNQSAARMYHYQHQKQQMIISDKTSAGRHTSASDLDSEDENDDGSYTVYECPGLASAHEMEIKNPLFNDDQTP